MDLDNAESTAQRKEPYYYLDAYGAPHNSYRQPSSNSSITSPSRISAISSGPSGCLNTGTRTSVPKVTQKHKAPVDQACYAMTHGGSDRHRQESANVSASGARSASVDLGVPGSFEPSAPPNPFVMGQFSAPGSKLASEERFMLSSDARSVSVGGAPAATALLNHPEMTRTPSQGGPGHPISSTREEKCTNPGKFTLSQQGLASGYEPGCVPLLEPVAPLKVSANRWVPTSAQRKPADMDTPMAVNRKVGVLLTKLTAETFDSISDQIIVWANKSENEKDGRTLSQVIRLVFEKATDEANWCEMYARLCRKMMDTISLKVQNDDMKNSDGKPIAGGQLFRRYLLNWCQEDFERGWVTKTTTASTAAATANDDSAIKVANEKKGRDEGELGSDEYYAAQKAKRRGLGLINFIGELFKVQMLTERIMHKCIKQLLVNVENPEEEEIEGLCQLLRTVGQLLDVPKTRAHMDVYFSRMKGLCKNKNVSSRAQFMLQDVIELRERKWQPRNVINVPTTLAQVHEAAVQFSISRSGSKRGVERGPELGPDGWAVAGCSQSRPPSGAGDQSHFGKINKVASMVMCPSSAFDGKKDIKHELMTRTNSSSNVFLMLSQNPELAVEPKTSCAPNQKLSTDMDKPKSAPQRKKLQLLPQSKPAFGDSAPTAFENEPETTPVTQMSEADVKKRIDEDAKEFFAVRNLDEADMYFCALTEEHRSRLVEKLIGSALESKEADARLVAEFFARPASQRECSLDVFEAGFIPMVELLDDIAIDVPKAFEYMAIMFKGAGLDKDDERLKRIVEKVMDSDKLLGLVRQYLHVYGTPQSRLGQLPHNSYQQPSSSITSSPRIPATLSGPSGRSNAEARAFVPNTSRKHKAITIKSEDGTELNLESLKKHSHQPSTLIPPVSPITENHQTASVKIESEEDKWKRQEQAKLKQEKGAVAQVRKAAEEKKRHRLQEVEPKFKEVAFRIERDELVGLSKEQLHEPSLPAVILARHINRLDVIQYPLGIKPPNTELNRYATDGKFRYDREFLLQFMQVCKEKPPQLPPLDILGLEPVSQESYAMTRGGSGRHRQASAGVPASGSRSASVGLGVPGGFKPCAPLNPFVMGQFSTPSSKPTSEKRFLLPSSSLPVSGGSNATVSAASNRFSMTWTPSPGESECLEDRKREKSTSPCESALDPDSSADTCSTSVTPVQMSSNGQMPMSTQSKVIGTETRGIVVEDIKGLLRKLIAEKFDYISDQIISCVNTSENMNDDQTLVEVSALIIERASAETNQSEMYARLSVKMVQSIRHKVPYHGIKGSDSKPITGGQLFRRYFLNRCQDEFERWISDETSSNTTAFKANNGQTIVATSEEQGRELYSDEFYVAQKAKHHGLGLIKFIGELFKCQILTERIMHECVKKLLGYVENPGEETLEGLCRLLRIVGQMLDVSKARAQMDVYFSRMKEFVRNDYVSLQVRASLQDVIKLRERKWQPHDVASVPITLAPVHQVTSIDTRWATEDAQAYRGQYTGPVAWAMAGDSQPGPPPIAGDLSQFGKIKPTLVVDPSSVFAGENKHELFSTVSSNPDPISHPRCSFVLESPNHRLFPQDNPAPDNLTHTGSHNEPEGTPAAQTTEINATKKINVRVKEFFTVRRLEQTDGYFTGLPKKHHFRLVARLVTSALEGNEEDARLVAEFFARPTSRRECSPHIFEAGFVSMAETLDDIAIDAPKAFEYIAAMLKGAGLDRDKERLTRIAKKVMDSDKLLQFVMHNLSASVSSASSLLNPAVSDDVRAMSNHVDGEKSAAPSLEVDRNEARNVRMNLDTIAGSSQSRPPSKAGDLSQFGKISKVASMVIGPKASRAPSRA